MATLNFALWLLLEYYGDFTMNAGTLYVVATPIGNLDDLTPRARRALNEVDLIAAEDTRHTRRLLSHFGIKTRQTALHEHNEEAASKELVSAMQGGISVALVSDAGTPLLSDPGYQLVAAAHAAGIPVSPVPGVSAVVAALSVAGLATDRFCFEGFLPARSSARRERLQQLQAERRTLVFYESVHRIAQTTSDLAEIFGEARGAFIGRELTKLHEQCSLSTLGSLQADIDAGTIVQKGEFVIVVAGNTESDSEISDAGAIVLLTLLMEYLPGKQAVEVVARATGAKRNDLYKEMLRQKEGDDAS